MQAKLRNGRIVSGRIAEIFYKKGIAKPVEQEQGEPEVKPKRRVKRKE